MTINMIKHFLRTAGLIFFLLTLTACSTDGSDSNWLKKTSGMANALGISGSGQSSLGVAEIAAGLQEALRVGTGDVVSRLGETGGFSNDKAVHIPLPENLQNIQSKMGAFGLSGLLDDLETRINSAAEMATPKAKTLFLNAISGMTIDDAMAIYKGPNNAATEYFRARMQDPLAREFRPIIQQSLNDVAALQLYDDFMAKYQAIPLMPDVKGNLTEHVIDKGMDGIFYYLAQEEAAIRENPAKRTTALLQRVFGGQ